MKLNALVDYLNDLLKIHDIEDDSLNGLQVENSGEVGKVALSVDASLIAFQKAEEAGADLLLVHHGLFWGKPFTLTGPWYERIRALITADIALYAAHLPLDMHPEYGNNAQIQQILGWPVKGDFGEYHGSILGKEVRLEHPTHVEAVAEHVAHRLQCEPVVWRFGAATVRRIGYVSGGGLSMLEQAIDAGYDLYITGEPKHSAYWTAKEAGINVIFAGHYTTETLGVKALGAHLQEKFGLDTVFIDLPTGH